MKNRISEILKKQRFKNTVFQMESYASDIQAAKVFFDSTNEEVAKICPELRVIIMRSYIESALHHLKSCGCDKPESNGYPLFCKIEDAYGELDNPVAEDALSNCLEQLNRESIIQADGIVIIKPITKKQP